MMWSSVLILTFSLVGSVSAIWDASFYSKDNNNPDKASLYIQSAFGNPSQFIENHLYLNEGDPNPQLLNRHTCGSGFDPNASTTFQWTSSFPGGVYGNDRIIFGDPVDQSGTKFRILNDDCDLDKTFVSLRPAHGGDDFTFIGDFLLKQSDPVVVLNYNQIGVNGSTPTSGKLTLGGRPDDLCDNDWTYFESQKLDGFDSWALLIDQLLYPKNILSKPKKAKLSIDDYNLYIPEPYYTTLLLKMGASTDGFISCNKNKYFNFLVNGTIIQLGPGEYLDRSYTKEPGICKLRIKVQDPLNDYFTLPLTFFRNFCFLLDYRSKEVGIAQNLAQQVDSTSKFIKASNVEAQNLVF